MLIHYNARITFVMRSAKWCHFSVAEVRKVTCSREGELSSYCYRAEIKRQSLQTIKVPANSCKDICFCR